MLGDGGILEQGTFDNLRSQNGFVGKLLLHPEILEPEIQVDTVKAKSAQQPQAPVSKALKGASAADKADLTRQIGDTAVYMYYFRQIGWKIASVLLTCSFFFAFGTKFPGKFP